MRYIILTTLVAFAARCTAQGPSLATLDNLPSCAKPCANTLPAQCNLGVSCICGDQAFITSISCCIATACSQSDQQKTLQVAQQLCDTVNVKLPSAAACSGSSSVASSTGSATSAATSTASSAVSQASTSGTSATSSGGATAVSATGSTTSATPSSTTAAKGAGERLGSHVGAVGAAVAALALL